MIKLVDIAKDESTAEQRRFFAAMALGQELDEERFAAYRRSLAAWRENEVGAIADWPEKARAVHASWVDALLKWAEDFASVHMVPHAEASTGEASR